METLIQEAKKRIKEIVRKSREAANYPDHYLALYESEAGYTLSYIRKGQETRTAMIAFGSKRLTSTQVMDHILYQESFL